MLLVDHGSSKSNGSGFCDDEAGNRVCLVTYDARREDEVGLLPHGESSISVCDRFPLIVMVSGDSSLCALHPLGLVPGEPPPPPNSSFAAPS